MEFDKILEKLGDFGLYQKLVYMLICFSSTYCGMYAVMSVIFLATPEHRCKIPGLPNDTYEIQNSYHQELISRFIPPSSDDDAQEYDKCNLYVFNASSINFDNSSRPINASLLQCEEWVYSDKVFIETLASKMNIVCDKTYQTSLIKSLYFVGKFIGALTYGNLSDIIGRKMTFYIAALSMFGLTLGMSWSSNYIVYGVVMILIGAATQGIFPVGFVIGVEFVGPTKRKWAGVVIEYFFSIGLVILVVVSYLIRHWKYINLACSLPGAFFIFYIWLLPESPRWLISKNRYEEANTIVRKAAKVNKITLGKADKLEERTIGEKTPEQQQGRIWQLFTSRVLLIRSLIIFFNWCIVSMMYYGLSLNAGNLQGDFYLNMFLSGLVEFPANTTVLLLVDRIGRKKIYCASMLIGGIACLSTIFPILSGEEAYQSITTALAMIGKYGVTAGFSTIYFFSAELFPTVVRNAGVGASSCASRIGGIAAPYIADSAALIGGDFGKIFPLGLFGIVSIIAGLTALFLPETLNEILPETIEDGKMFGKPEYQAKKQKSKIEDSNGFTGFTPGKEMTKL